MQRRFVSVEGFLLAGGRSRRMGRPKLELELGGETLLERQLRLLRAVTRAVAVIGPPERAAGIDFRAIPDEHAGLGPLGGIVTALAQTRSEYNLLVGCDLPFLEARFLRFLCWGALTGRAEVTVPESPSGRLHPTCAVYRRRALGAARASLERGDYRVRSFFPRVNVHVLRWREIARAGFSARYFFNMNTPEDYRSARLRLGLRV
jgi:molybdopterin-guanine dinucleotide biosynthesis protein A